MLKLQVRFIEQRNSSLALQLKRKTLLAAVNQAHLNNPIQSVVIFPCMHNAIVKFNNKKNRMTNKDPVS